MPAQVKTRLNDYGIDDAGATLNLLEASGGTQK